MKHITITLMLTAALLAASSCRIEKNDTYFQESELAYFSKGFVKDAIAAPVLALQDCLADTMDIFKPGFDTTRNGLRVMLISAQDSTWAVSNAGESDMLKFESAVRMLHCDSLGLRSWQCAGEGTYSDSDSYYATLTTVTPATMNWVKESTSSTLIYNMAVSGVFSVTTFTRADDTPLHRCTLTYKDSYISSSGGTTDYKVENLYRR